MAGQRIFRELISSGRYKDRPKCVIEGCNNPGHDVGYTRQDGSKTYRKTCAKHHFTKYGIGDWEYKRFRKRRVLLLCHRHKVDKYQTQSRLLP